MKVFLIGARGSGIGALARALTHPPRSRFLIDAQILATLERLWMATEARVRRPGTPWARPDPPDWVDGAVADFGRMLIKQHAQGAPVVGIAEPEGSAARIGTWFPAAVVLHLVRNGLQAPITPPDDPIAAAEAGLDWAKRWSDAITAAEGASVIRFEDIGVQLPQIGAALSLPVGPWQPRPRQHLTGPAVEGFACCGPARQQMAALGHDLPDPGPMSLMVPTLAAAWARALIAEGVPGEALSLLNQTAATDSPVLLDALGDAYRGCGDEDAAAAAWLDAVSLPGAPSSAWVSLLAMSERSEGLAVVRVARTSEDDTVRAAAARWMVDRGMDHEAAEAVARVHGQRWYVRA